LQHAVLRRRVMFAAKIDFLRMQISLVAALRTDRETSRRTDQLDVATINLISALNNTTLTEKNRGNTRRWSLIGM